MDLLELTEKIEESGRFKLKSVETWGGYPAEIVLDVIDLTPVAPHDAISIGVSTGNSMSQIISEITSKCDARLHAIADFHEEYGKALKRSLST